MKIKVTVELGKAERRAIARWRNERLGEHGRTASRKQCKEAVLYAVNAFLHDEDDAARAQGDLDEGGD